MGWVQEVSHFLVTWGRVVVGGKAAIPARCKPVMTSSFEGIVLVVVVVAVVVVYR